MKAIARAPKALADAANLLREQWRVTLPWALASCGFALQLGQITAAGIVPYLMTALDPRKMLVGGTAEDGSSLTGLLDSGSFVETLAGWAKTVVCGRGRLGGLGHLQDI